MKETSEPAPKTLPSPGSLLFLPVDIASIVFFRITFGGIMLWEMWKYFRGGWIERYYIVPDFHFTYFGFSWVKPWPGDGMFLHFFVLAVLAVFIILGIRYRVSATLFFLGITYVFLADRARYLNHNYLVCLVSFMMIFIPAHRAFSIDVWRRPELARRSTPVWSLWMIRFLVGMVYFYGGLAKIEPDWLRGEPLRTWLALKTHYPIIGPYFTTDYMPILFAYSGLFIDLLIVPLLLWRRTRVVAFMIVVIFNGLNSTLWRIGIFPWLMIAASAMYFPPDWPRRLLGRWWPAIAKGARLPAPTLRPLTLGQKLTAALLGIFVMFELLIPFRHLLYPGNSNWTDEGDRFAWHMMLRTKRGTATFFVTDPVSHKTWEVGPSDHLEPFQARLTRTRTDMILQFSHYLADRFRERGYDQVEVRAVVFVSLNGRTPQLLIDPQVNLAAERASLRPAKWILPLKEED